MDARRGYVPEDERFFSSDALETMRTASRHIQYLVNEGYDLKQASTFVGNHFLLSERQRLAVMRSIGTQKELDAREAEITKRELMATAKNTLTDKKLPLELADILVYTDAESCNASIAAVEKAFNTAVEAAVQERLKGGDPMKKAPQGNDALQKQIETAMAGGLYQ